MSECCKQGSFHKGTPNGTETKLDKYDVYVTGDENSSSAIFVVHDVYGWKLNNTRILADKYAKGTGARVYVPDLLKGEAVPPEVLADPAKHNFDLMEWLGGHHPRDDFAFPQAVEFVKAIKATQKSVKKIGAIGFCWGAPTVLYLGSTRVPKEAHIDAIGFAHPSLVEVSDFETIDADAVFLTSEHDQMLPDEKRNAAIDVTKKVTKERGTFIKWVYYPNTTHGFAIRGDEEAAYTARCMQDAANEAVSHFATALV